MPKTYYVHPDLFESGLSRQSSRGPIDLILWIAAFRLASFHDRLQSASHPNRGGSIGTFLNNFVGVITQLP